MSNPNLSPEEVIAAAGRASENLMSYLRILDATIPPKDEAEMTENDRLARDRGHSLFGMATNTHNVRIALLSPDVEADAVPTMGYNDALVGAFAVLASLPTAYAGSVRITVSEEKGTSYNRVHSLRRVVAPGDPLDGMIWVAGYTEAPKTPYGREMVAGPIQVLRATAINSLCIELPALWAEADS